MKNIRKSLVSSRGYEPSERLKEVSEALRTTNVNGTASFLPANSGNSFIPMREMPSYIKTIKIDVKTWSTLKNLKKENETFEDVIKELLNERTKSASGSNMELIQYKRKKLFIETDYEYKNIGAEFEFNDIKNNQNSFVLDLKINKIFYGKKIYNPSVFFGLESQYKHFSNIYLNIYLKCTCLALEKEFRVKARMTFDKDYEDIARWRKIYYDYNLSEESFTSDIEDPLKLSEEEVVETNKIANMRKSESYKIWGHS